MPWLVHLLGTSHILLHVSPSSVPMLACRHMLQQLLKGNELAGDTLGSQEAGMAAIAAARDKYSLKLVDVNSTNKGSPAGGVQSFSAMVVVGDGEVLLMSCLLQDCHVVVVPTWASHWSAFLLSVMVSCHCCCHGSQVMFKYLQLEQALHFIQGFLIC